MGTTADKLNKLLETKAAVKTAIIGKGQSVSDSDTFASYADKVDAIVTLSEGSADATATAAQILTESTAYVKGAKVTGTMVNQGTKTAALNAGESYAIPAGYHNGSGKVTANSLASQTDGTAVAGDILSGKTAYVDGAKVTGTIATKTATDMTVSGATVTAPAGYYASATSKSVATATQATPSVSIDSAGLITASATQSAGYVAAGTESVTKQLPTMAAKTVIPGTSNNTAVSAGVYTTGAVTVKGDANLVAANIAKGVTIFNVTGTLAGASPNGAKWTRGLASSSAFTAVHNANGLWVAGGSSVGPYYSTDGKTWTQSDNTTGARSPYYANGLWVAGGTGLKYSTDGMTWTQSNITSGTIMAVYYANGLWVAGGSSVGPYYSTDGKTWTQSDSVSGGRVFCNANGLWVAGSTGLKYSTDGKSWTYSNITSGTISSVRNADGIWVTSGYGPYYSTDGKTWTKNNLTSVTVNDVYNANGLWVAASQNNGLYYSTDGMTWTQSNVTSGIFWHVHNANGMWVAGSTAGLYYSADGMTWTQSNITSGTFYGSRNANGLWVIAGSTGLYYSVTWEPS